MQSAAFGIFQTQVERHHAPCCEHFELTLSVGAFPSATPGQFVQVLCRNQSEVSSGGALLRRPFSIGGLRRRGAGVEIDILGRVIGPGTAWLNARREGDVVEILGPLGTGFAMPQGAQRALLVAGGVGLPPIRWWGETLKKQGVSCEFILGARSREFLAVSLKSDPKSDGAWVPRDDEFVCAGMPLWITTEDGSCGMKGRVTDALSVRLSAQSRAEEVHVFACGPEAMLYAVARLCRERGVGCSVSMERVMGCGLGTCQSCVVRVLDSSRDGGWRYALCCREGPVLDAALVDWARCG